MNILNNILEQWSRYEINMEIIFLIGIFLASILIIYTVTKEKKLLILSSISLIVSFLLNILGTFILITFRNIPFTNIFRMIPVVTLLLLLSNLGILIGIYLSTKDSKKFKIEDIRTEYFSDSIKQTVFLMLLGSSTLFFLSVQTEAVVSISFLSTILTIWFTYWISKYILK